MHRKRQLIHAAAIVDADHLFAPGAMLVQGCSVIDIGSPQHIGQPESAERIDARNSVVLPAMVNSHTHLDLTHIGPVPYEGDFVQWIELVRERRHGLPEEIGESVMGGVKLARAGGTGAVGDIAGGGSVAATVALRVSGMPGVSYAEVFGRGQRQRQAVENAISLVRSVAPFEAGVQIGLQPHAPYSCGKTVYNLLSDVGLPLATHLAETPEEVEFCLDGTGPLADFLMAIGVSSDSSQAIGQHPVEAIVPLLARASPVLAAHLNYVEPGHLKTIKASGVTVVYCPRASAYFGHPCEGHAHHRYEAMLDYGIPVALGTDSLLCLDTPDRISILDEMRLLYRRDGADPTTLIRMATVAGAKALGFDDNLVRFSRGPILGAVAIPCGSGLHTDPVNAALATTSAPSWPIPPSPSSELDRNAEGLVQARADHSQVQ